MATAAAATARANPTRPRPSSMGTTGGGRLSHCSTGGNSSSSGPNAKVMRPVVARSETKIEPARSRCVR
eukprot:1287232-Pleurochrysis_carterae.AAC.1